MDEDIVKFFKDLLEGVTMEVTPSKAAALADLYNRASAQLEEVAKTTDEA